MKVLYLVTAGDHAHDYAVDHLLTGFYNILGAESVFDWPEKECVHLPNIEARDDCQIDSDQCLPRKHRPLVDIASQVDMVVLTGGYDAIVTQPDFQLHEACRLVASHVPIVAVDGFDARGNYRQAFETIAGRPVAAYFKRELPFGASFALPLPLSYPASRVPKPMPEKANRVFYHATYHGGGDPGQPRLEIARALGAFWDGISTALHLKRDMALQTEQFDIRLTPGQAKGTRPSPEEYHERMARSLIGISWNGARNFDNNRLWENFAYGLAQVSEKPRIQMLNQPEDGKHCVYVVKAEDVAGEALSLLRAPDRAREIAVAGHEHFLRFHSSERRAEFIMGVVGKMGGR